MLGDRDYSLVVEPGLSTKLSLEFRRKVLCAFTEARYNALRHAGTGRIEVEIDGRSEHFGFRVRDKGKGFDPNQPGDGHGIENMRNRAAMLRGLLWIDSTVGRGTLVDFRAPVA